MMNPVQNVKMALSAVWTNRFRSMLTILGIVIGITTVVSVASLLTGLRGAMVTLFQELGPDNIFVAKTGGNPAGPPPQKERKRRAMRPEYVQIIKAQATTLEDAGISMYIPPASGAAVTAKVPGFETDSLNIQGSSANMNNLAPRDFDSGRYFTPEEDLRGAKVAVIGHDLAAALFPAGNAVGRAFSVGGAEYTVVGVYAKAKGAVFGQNPQDTLITLPLRTAQKRYPQVDRYNLTCKARPGLRADALGEVESIMRRIRGLKGSAPNDFSIATPDQIIAQFDSITGLIGLVAIAISALGLLVGGIGVMNIMLVSVTERTREIGVRKAIGARRGDIVGQFLLEATTLTGIGGVLGILIALMVTMLVSFLVPALPSIIPTWAVVAGFTVSVAIGLFFGTWPAVKASRLDPVEALRYE